MTNTTGIKISMARRTWGYMSCVSNEFSGSETIVNTRKFMKAQEINKNRIDAWAPSLKFRTQ